MPPIPIYSQSPINAAKASGVTPKTDSSDDSRSSGPPAAVTSPAAVLPGTGSPQRRRPPPPKPGATPSLPQPTGAVPSSYSYGLASQPIQPTPTRKAAESGPPPPQPGAVPLPPGVRPPPRTGEAYQYQPPPPQTAMPPSITSTPPRPYPVGSRGTPTTAAAAYPASPASQSQGATAGARAGLPGPTGLSVSVSGGASSEEERHSMEHPPGYVQNVYATDMTAAQREAASTYQYHADASSGSGRGSSVSGFGDDADEEGVWDAAKKLAKAAGERLSAAESEVWRRINHGE